MSEVGRVLEERQVAHGHELAQTMDAKIASLAKLVRSDNETLAEQIVADQEASKQALRAMKELQASLPAEVIGMVEERFTSLAESIERSNEMLAARIDRMAETLGRRQNDDIQVVIDRMGDAMHALASIGKPEPASRPSTPRIELE
jgi:DNA anti-recombination protein RmuC